MGLWTVHPLNEGGELSKAPFVKGVWAVRKVTKFMTFFVSCPLGVSPDSRQTILKAQGPLNGGGLNEGFPGLDLSFLFCPFFSFLGLSRFFWDFPDLLGDGPGTLPICPSPLSRPKKSTYEEQSRKGPRHNLDLSRKKFRSRPGKPNQRKGQNEKFMNFSPIFV